MTFAVGHAAFQLYVFASAVLVVTLYVLAFYTGSVRDKRRAVVNPEDVRVYHGASVVDVEHPDVQRVKRAHQNLLENAVPFFVLGLLYASTDPNLWMARALFAVFVGVRLLHVAFYLGARQPWRAASFGIGAVVNMIMLVQVVRVAI
jgi:uncharacterized MAPEG superfamily protein